MGILAFIIIDLEFNNLSGIHKCIPNVYNDYPNLKKLDLVNEIIEIGAVKLDSHMQIPKILQNWTLIHPKIHTLFWW